MSKRSMCLHETVWMGLCADCGEPATVEDDYIKAGFVSLDSGFKVKRACAMRMEAETVQSLTVARKCVLVLDIDHTLVHVTDKNLGQVDKVRELTEILAAGEAVNESEIYRFNDGRSVFHMKIRPGAMTFLSNATDRFQLYVYTHGTLEYASVVLQALDPVGALFGSPPRLIAREGQRLEHKSLKKIFPTEHKLVLILDDRSDVWGEAEDNLVQVTPYLFFHDGDRSRIGLESSCPPYKPLGWDSDALDRQLAVLRPVLDNLVAVTYFSAEGDDADVRIHLRELRESVLQGMKIATSGLIPTTDPDPLSHPISVLLRNLGAIAALDDDVDVLVSASAETRRARELSARGVPIVHPWYLLHAQATLKRPQLEHFLLNELQDANLISHWQLSNEASSDSGDDLLDDLID